MNKLIEWLTGGCGGEGGGEGGVRVVSNTG